MQGGGAGAPPNRSMSSSLIASMLSTRTLKQQRDQFFSSVHSADGLRYLWSERALVRRSRDSLSLVVGLIELPPERLRLSPAPALRGPTAPRSPRSLLSPRPCKSPTPNAPGGGCAPPALARVTATPRTDPAPACRPGLPRGPQCGAARGYVKVLALHSACASGAHARARRAHTDYSVRLCAAFSILKLGF